MKHPTADELMAHSRFVHALARSLLFDRHEAADVAQDALAIALENSQNIRKTTRAWLTGIVRNRVRGTLRSKKRRIAREQMQARPDLSPAAADAVAQVEMQRRLVDAVGELEEIYRTIIVMRFFDGLPPRRIARTLGLAIETVKKRQRRGLVLLRGMLDQSYGDRSSWCLALAGVTLVKPLATASAAVGGVSQLVWGGAAMKAGTVVVGALVASTAAVGVVWDARGDQEESARRANEPRAVVRQVNDRKPVQTISKRGAQRSEPSIATTKILGALVNHKPQPVLATRTTLPGFSKAAIGVSLQGGLADVRFKFTDGFVFRVAGQTKPSHKPDDLTANYLRAMTKRWDALRAGQDRTELLGRITDTHRDYCRRTGDAQFFTWLGRAMARAHSASEQSLITRALAHTPDDAQRELILRWAASPSASVRGLAVALLPRVRGRARAVARTRLLTALLDADAGVRRIAAQTAASMIGATDLPYLTAALGAETDLSAARQQTKTILRLDQANGKRLVRGSMRRSSRALVAAIEKELR